MFRGSQLGSMEGLETWGAKASFVRPEERRIGDHRHHPDDLIVALASVEVPPFVGMTFALLRWQR